MHNPKKKTRTGIAHLTRADGNLTTTDKQKADELNNFFSSVFTREDTDNMPDTFLSRTDSKMTDIHFTRGDVENKLNKMNPNKSPGPDGAAPRVLKELQEIIAEPLYLIFRQSLDLGKAPVSWKMGLVSPIFKKGNRHQAKNYRPVSLTSVICKILESSIGTILCNIWFKTNSSRNVSMGLSKVAPVSLNSWQY